MTDTLAPAAPRELRGFGGGYVESLADGAADVDRAYSAAGRAFETWGQTTPHERQQALLKFAVTASDHVPLVVDPLRFSAGADRVLEGRAAGEYLKGHTSQIRPTPLSSWRCGTAGSSTRATATERTCRCTASRTARAPST